MKKVFVKTVGHENGKYLPGQECPKTWLDKYGKNNKNLYTIIEDDDEFVPEKTAENQDQKTDDKSTDKSDENKDEQGDELSKDITPADKAMEAINELKN